MKSSKGTRSMTDEQATVIKELLKDGVSFKEIQQAFGINRNTLASLSSGRSYKEITPTDFPKGQRRTDIHRFNEGYSERG